MRNMKFADFLALALYHLEQFLHTLFIFLFPILTRRSGACPGLVRAVAYWSFDLKPQPEGLKGQEECVGHGSLPLVPRTLSRK